MDPSQEASHCNFHHPLSLFSALKADSSNPDKVRRLRISSCLFNNIFTNYNSLVDVSSQSPIDLEVRQTHFKDITTCGSLISSERAVPSGPSFPEVLIPQFLGPLDHAMNKTVSRGQRISIQLSSFENIGSNLGYSEQTDLKASHFKVNDFITAAPLMNLNSFPGQVQIANCFFTRNKLGLDLTVSVDPLESQEASGSLLLKKYCLLQQSLIQVRNHHHGIVLERNKFTNNSALNGLVTINLSSDFSQGALLLNNQFYYNSAWSRAVALNLQSQHNATHSRSCVGFHLLNNILAQNAHLPGQTSIVYLACIPQSFAQTDGVSDISAHEAISRIQRLSIPQHEPTFSVYRLESGETLEVEDNLTSLVNNTFSENFRGNSYGQCLTVTLMRGLQIKGLHLYRNGDIAFNPDNVSTFMIRRGAHQSQQKEELALNEVQTPSKQEVRDELVVIIKSRELIVQEVEAIENWMINPAMTGHVISCLECESFLLEKLRVNRIYKSLPAPLEDFIVNAHDILNQTIVVSAYDPIEKTAGYLIGGNLLALNSCSIQGVHFQNELVSLTRSNSLTIHDSTFFEVRGNTFARSDNSFRSVILHRSSFANIEFNYPWFSSMLFEMINCSLNNTAIKSMQYESMRIFQIFFYARSYVKDSIFYNPCGQFICGSQLFLSVSSTNSFEFQNNSFIGMHTLTQDVILRIKGQSVLFQNCSFINNTGLTGGVINIPSGSLTFRNSKFINNSAKSGGVIYFQGPGLLRVQNSLFEGNKAENSGGVFFFTENSQFEISNCTFVRNESKDQSSVGHFEGVRQSSFRNCSFLENVGYGSFILFKSSVDFDKINYRGNIDHWNQSTALNLISSRVSIKSSHFSNQQDQLNFQRTEGIRVHREAIQLRRLYSRSHFQCCQYY